MDDMIFSQTASKLLVSVVPSSLLTPVGLLLFHPPYSSIRPCIHLYRFCPLFKDGPRLSWETGCQRRERVPLRANLVTSDDRAKENILSLVGHTSNYRSALSPYSTSVALATPWPSRNDTKAVSSPFPTRAEYLRQPLRAESLKDALETLRNYDMTIIMDDSSSMTGSLWNEAEQALATLVDVASPCDASAAGIDIHFLNCSATMTRVTDSRVVHEQFAKFQPFGPTTIGNCLGMIIGDYFGDLYAAKRREDGCKNIKPLNVLIITDGASSDDVESVIVYFARLLEADKWPLVQVGIQFVQIGNSRHAAQFLRKLDDLKQAHIRDIVDTTPYIGQLHADMLIKVLVGGINRRVDTKGGDSVMF